MTNETAVAVSDLSSDEISAILAGAGAIDQQQVGDIRMKTDGNTFKTENDIWLSHPKTGAPAFTARILGAPVQYQAYYFNEADAATAGRPEMAKRFCKSHYDNPQEAREFGTNGASCRACPFQPWGNAPSKCSWKGDLAFQIIPEDGHLTGEEPVYILTLSTTSMIEYRGTKKSNNAGSASDENFMFKLAKLSASMADEWGMTATDAVLMGLNALKEGMVAAEFRIITMTNTERGQSWPVVSLTPVHVQRPDEVAKLAAEVTFTEVTETETPADELPFD